MLFRFFKIFLGIISFFVVIFLVFFTFFVDRNSGLLDKLDFSKTVDKNTYELITDESGGVLTSTPKHKSGAFYKKINNLDSVYFSSRESFSVKNSLGISTIELKEGRFILELPDLTKNYKIKSDFFDINMLGGGSVYIDTSPDRNVFFSIDSSFKIDFKDSEDDRIINSMYLFPHNFLVFDPSKNIDLENTDIFRIKTKVSSGYFKYKLTYDIRLNNLLKKDGVEFFSKVFSFLEKNHGANDAQYNNLMSIEVSSFPGEDYIETYFSYLINDSKKIVYYKNRILRDISYLLISKSADQEIISNITDTLAKLKTISNSEYDYMLLMIRGFYETIVLRNNLENQSNLYNFADLVSSLENSGEGSDSLEKSLNYLQTVYSYYSFGKIEDINKYFKNFIKDFYGNLDISNNKVVFNERTDRKLMESFLFYMEDFIDSNLFVKGNKNLVDINYILQNYLFLSNTIYFSNSSADVVKTGLIKNKDILVFISNFIFENMLEKSEDDNIFFTKDNLSDFKNDDIKNLETNVGFINKLYLDNASLLDLQKDKILLGFYKTIEEKFKQYFLALLDYSKYLSLYDVNQRGLIDHISDNGKTEEKTYALDDVKSYLSSFNYVNLGDTKIEETENKNVFKITNLLVKSKNISFLIDFNNYKNISYIYINGEKQSSSYDLDELEVYWLELYDSSSSSDKNQYDFKNFFVQVFFDKKSPATPGVVVDNTEKVTESKVISAFKKDILSSGGELGKLSGVLDIKYNDLIVNNFTDIQIKDSILSTTYSENNSTKKYSSNLSSKYFLEKEGKSYFGGDESINLKVSFNSSRIFGGKELKVIGNVLIDDFEDTMNNISGDFETINNLYSILSNYFDTRNIDIDYLLKDNHIIFKLENNGKIISITLLSDKVISINYSGVEYIQQPIDYSLIEDTLEGIN